MTDPRTDQSVADLLGAIEAFADECRRAYRCPTELVLGPTVLNDYQYARLERLVASGSAPPWLKTEWDHGLFVRAERGGQS